MRKTVALAGVALGLAAPLWAQDMACNVDVAVSGSQQNLADRDFAAHAMLADVALTPTTVGFGPGANLAAEITIIDGVFYVAKPEGAGIALTTTPDADQGAVFLVRASAGRWLALPPLPDNFDLSELSDLMGTAIAHAGCEGAITIPFKITGHAATLDWSIEGQPETATGSFDDTDVTIVGIYSNHDKKDTFMVPGFNVHAHFYAPDAGIAGHVVDVSLENGARLFVPAT